MKYKRGMIFERINGRIWNGEVCYTEGDFSYKVILLRKGPVCKFVCKGCTGQPWRSMIIESNSPLLDIWDEFCCCVESLKFRLVTNEDEKVRSGDDP